MRTLDSPTRRTLLGAVLVLFAMIAAACGTDVAESNADLAAVAAADAPADSPLDLSADSEVEFDPNAETGVEYGATLDEWAEAYKAPSVLEPEPVPQAPTHGQEPRLDEIPSDSLSIAWEDLIPPGASGQEIIDQFAERLDAAEPGSDEASAIYDELKAAFNPEAVNTELNGREIRLAGFVAPLAYEDDIVTEFLLVPNFGACVHVPPPPPNQTVMVTVSKEDGLSIEDAWGAVWVEGTMVIESSDSVLAPASYRIDFATSGVYSGV